MLGVLGPQRSEISISASQATDRSTFCPMPGGRSQAASDAPRTEAVLLGRRTHPGWRRSAGTPGGALGPNAHQRARQTRQRVVPIETALRWRSQFAPQPTRSFEGFHRIDQRDRALMNAIASGALEYSDVKVGGGTRFDPCQQHHCFALWTWRPVKRDHDASPWVRRERYRTLSHRRMPLWDGDGEQRSTFVPSHLVNIEHLSR
jgi:hypothetical protein